MLAPPSTSTDPLLNSSATPTASCRELSARLGSSGNGSILAAVAKATMSPAALVVVVKTTGVEPPAGRFPIVQSKSLTWSTAAWIVQLLVDVMVRPVPTKLPSSPTFGASLRPAAALTVNVQLSSSLSIAGSGATLMLSETLARSSADTVKLNSSSAGIVSGSPSVAVTRMMYGSLSRASSNLGVPEKTPVSGLNTRLPLIGRPSAVNCSGSPSASVKLPEISSTNGSPSMAIIGFAGSSIGVANTG